MKDPGFNNIYCLVHAEQLSYQVCEAAFKEYDSLSQEINGNVHFLDYVVMSKIALFNNI